MARLSGLVGRIGPFLRAYRWTLLIAGAVVIGTALTPLIARSLPERERIVVGNTAGVLTSMIETHGYRILVGAGPTRSHAADMIGRSTRPWDREIDLLILPGWDDSHAVGALGLLERRSVHGVAVIGVPGEEPVWTMLERAARADDIQLRYLSSPHQLELGPEAELAFLALDQGSGAWIRLDYSGIRVDLVDTESIANAAPPADHFEQRNDHVVVAMRSQQAPEYADPLLLIRPRPFYRDEFEEPGAELVRELDRNEQVRLELDDGEIRVPLDDVER